MRLTDIAHSWLKESLKPGDITIDATLGNGHDALFLAQNIGEKGHVFGFDVQKNALQQSQLLLGSEPCRKTFFHQGHEHMASTLPESIKGKARVIMFNLGWLPGSDKSLITQAKTTVSALEQSFPFLAPNGKLSVMVYPGHEGGDHEAAMVMQWLENVCSPSDSELLLEKVIVPNRPTAPILLKISKKQ